MGGNKTSSTRIFKGSTFLTMHQYTKDCCDTCMRKCENLDIDRIKSKIYTPPTINKIELENEFDNTEFSKAINRTIVRDDYREQERLQILLNIFNPLTREY